MTKPSYTYDEAANKIAGWAWTNPVAAPITYGFTSSDPTDPGFARFTTAQIDAADAAMLLWADVANIKFQRVGTGDTGSAAYTNNATILFAASNSDPNSYGWGYLPGDRSASAVDGNVYLNTTAPNFTSLSNGSYDFMAIIHEIGHAVGLNHPGKYNGGSPAYATDAEYLQDSRQYTVMSYFAAENTGAFHGVNYASTPLLHDIAAVQKLYGANTATRAGDTTYGFNSNANRAQFHITNANQKVVFAIWDGGGTDTIDLSGYSQSDKIDLVPETFSDAGGLTSNIAIARGVIIENATGGSGDDTIIGNDAANALKGGAGNDVLAGGLGGDKIDGGAGQDTVLFKGKHTDYTFNSGTSGSVNATDHLGGRDGVDTLINDETAKFSDGTFAISSLITSTGWTPGIVTSTGGSNSSTAGADAVLKGTHISDLLKGGAAGEAISGLSGNDHIYGAGGNDLITGGTGRDVMSGGAGRDVFEFDTASETGVTSLSRDVITDFQHGIDRINLGYIDANSQVPNDQGFLFIGTMEFYGAPGSLRYSVINLPGTANDKVIVEGDLNGDHKADFEIDIRGTLTLTKADFIL